MRELIIMLFLLKSAFGFCQYGMKKEIPVNFKVTDSAAFAILKLIPEVKRELSATTNAGVKNVLLMNQTAVQGDPYYYIDLRQIPPGTSGVSLYLFKVDANNGKVMVMNQQVGPGNGKWIPIEEWQKK